MMTIFNINYENMSALDIVYLINAIFFIITYLIFVIPNIVFMIIGLFPFKKYPENKNRVNHYAFLIAARNEEKVIANLIESINRQTYPKDKITVFVVADNCSDHTAELARNAGAIVYERHDPEHATKGYALRFLVQNIQKDMGIAGFDAFFLFDADNLLDKNFVCKMDDAFMTGEKILCSYRNVKNTNNFISMSYAFHHYRKIRNYHNSRTKLGLGTTAVGTGTMFAREIIEQNGWEWLQITEDNEFTVDTLLRGYRVTFVGEAIFYDEQPTTFKVMSRQRIRWAKGQFLIFTQKTGPIFAKLFSKTKKTYPEGFTKGRYKYTLWDIFIYYYPLSIMVFLFSFGIFIAEFSIRYTNGEPFWQSTGVSVFSLGISYLQWYVVAILQLLPILILEWKMIPASKFKKIFYFFLFPFFDLLGLPYLIIAIFSKVTWRPIVHDKAYKIENLEAFYDKEDERRKKRKERHHESVETLNE